MQIKIKYFRDVDPIEKIEQGDWIDLRAAEEIKVPSIWRTCERINDTKSKLKDITHYLNHPSEMKQHFEVDDEIKLMKNLTDRENSYELSLKGLYKPIMIPLGVAMQLPKGHEAHLVVRSSTFKKFGIIQSNAPGIIDESYCGDNDEWFLAVIAMRNTVIPKNERICQFRIVKKMPPVEFEVVDILGNVDRGGHGSTDGIKS